MLADYMSLADGRKVRVEINLDTMIAWQGITGRDLAVIDDVKKDAVLLKALAFSSIQVGEQMDKRVFEVTLDEFGGLFRVAQVMQYIPIMNRQSVIEEKKSVPQKKGK